MRWGPGQGDLTPHKSDDRKANKQNRQLPSGQCVYVCVWGGLSAYRSRVLSELFSSRRYSELAPWNKGSS